MTTERKRRAPSPRTIQSNHPAGARIVRFIVRNGLSLGSFAELAGVGKSTLQKVLLRPNVELRIAFRIAATMGEDPRVVWREHMP